jgi:DNA-binding CsgD family transcriptional regulator
MGLIILNFFGCFCGFLGIGIAVTRKSMHTNAHEPVFISIPRNCPRCGLEFRGARAERVCTECRTPKIRERKTLTRHLTFRENQIVALILQAKANKEIAWELHLTEGTIKEYLNTIYRKLEVRNRTDLAIWELTKQREVSDQAPVSLSTESNAA